MIIRESEGVQNRVWLKECLWNKKVKQVGLKGLDDFFWSTSKMKDDVWKETEEFHSCFQSATLELLHCEQYFLLQMLVGFLIKHCQKKI